jgi:hypothetical protein
VQQEPRHTALARRRGPGALGAVALGAAHMFIGDHGRSVTRNGIQGFVVAKVGPARPGRLRRPPRRRGDLPQLRAHLEHQVERRLGGPPEPGEAGVGHHLPDGSLTGLGTECVPAALRQLEAAWLS